jgi:hypothetical protein
MFHAIDDEDIDLAFGRLQLEAELFLQGCGKRRSLSRRGYAVLRL